MSESAEERCHGSGRWRDAIEWHTRISEATETDLTSGRIRDWLQWYAEPENQRIFQHVCQLLEARGGYRKRRRVPPGKIEADPYDPIESVGDWKHASSTAEIEQRRWLRHRWTVQVSAVALLAIATMVSAVLVLRPQWRRFATTPRNSATALYQTGLGGLKAVHLVDGSTVMLGARTRLSVDYTSRSRTVRLLHGEAWFRDKDIANWPFTVIAGHGTITALGTSFVVNRDSDRITVTVTEGTVEVSAGTAVPKMQSMGSWRAPSISLPVVRVGRGEAISYSDRGALGTVKNASAPIATAWTQGLLVFDDVPLRYVAENVNRYWSRPILLTPKAGNLRFSGLIDEHEIQDWLNGLSTIFPVGVSETGSAVCIHMRGPSPSRPDLAPCQAAH